jgi:hypothetical protein
MVFKVCEDELDYDYDLCRCNYNSALYGIRSGDSDSDANADVDANSDDYIDSSLIGKIKYIPANSFGLTILCESIDFKSKITSFSSVDKLLIFDNGNIFMAYIDTSRDKNICVFDEDYNLKKTIKFESLFDTKSCSTTFNTMLNEILICYYNDDNYFYPTLSILNQDLIVQRELNVESITN